MTLVVTFSFNTHPSCLSMIPSVQNWGSPSIMIMILTMIQVLPEGLLFLKYWTWPSMNNNIKPEFLRRISGPETEILCFRWTLIMPWNLLSSIDKKVLKTVWITLRRNQHKNVKIVKYQNRQYCDTNILHMHLQDCCCVAGRLTS